jgi:hypothetical protein
MMAVPARIAGCSTIVMATPPRPDGSITPEVLYCAKKAGVTHVLKAGGAQVGGWVGGWGRVRASLLPQRLLHAAAPPQGALPASCALLRSLPRSRQLRHAPMRPLNELLPLPLPVRLLRRPWPPWPGAPPAAPRWTRSRARATSTSLRQRCCCRTARPWCAPRLARRTPAPS